MAARERDHVMIDVDAVATEFENVMSKQPLSMPPGCCIFRAPPILSRHNPRDYVPDAFSIGPLHYKKLQPVTEATQKIKLKYLHELVARPWLSMKDAGPNAKLKALTKAVSSVQEEARECYAGPLELEMKEFVQVLVLDGCFLVELLRKKSDKNLVQDDDPVFSMSCMMKYLSHDLLLLENQIPWIVLELLFGMIKQPTNEKPLVQLVIDFFGHFIQVKKLSLIPFGENPHGSKHILDLLRNLLVENSKRQEKKKPAEGQSISDIDLKNSKRQEKMKPAKWKPIKSMKSLSEAGIVVKPDKSSQSILDIDFEKGVLKIPRLFIQETTKTALRNLICLEQCCPNYKPIITSYAILMDNLVNTKADMEILTESKAVFNWLGIKDATNLFNNLYDDTCVNENYYNILAVDLRKYCKRRFPKWRTVLMGEYFRHPWALMSVIAAVVILILTITQTVFAGVALRHELLKKN